MVRISYISLKRSLKLNGLSRQLAAPLFIISERFAYSETETRKMNGMSCSAGSCLHLRNSSAPLSRGRLYSQMITSGSLLDALYELSIFHASRPLIVLRSVLCLSSAFERSSVFSLLLSTSRMTGIFPSGARSLSEIIGAFFSFPALSLINQSLVASIRTGVFASISEIWLSLSVSVYVVASERG